MDKQNLFLGDMHVLPTFPESEPTDMFYWLLVGYSFKLTNDALGVGSSVFNIKYTGQVGNINQSDLRELKKMVEKNLKNDGLDFSSVFITSVSNLGLMTTKEYFEEQEKSNEAGSP